MNTVLALLQKEIALFLRDKTAVLMTFLVPFVLIAIMGSIFGDMGGDSGPSARVKLAVHLADPASDVAQTLLDALKSEESLHIIDARVDAEGAQQPFDEASLRQGIKDHDFNFALIVPTDFIKSDGIGLKLKLLYNPRNDIETQMVNGLTQKAIFTKLPQLLAGQVDDYSRREMGSERYDQFLDGMAAAVALAMDADYDEVRANMGLRGLSQSWLDSAAAPDGEGADDEGDKDSSNLLGELIALEKDQVFGAEVKNPQLTRIVGGYAVMFLLFAVTGSSTSLFEERNDGIFARLLSMPVRRHHILWSKYLFNTLLGITQVLTLFFFASLLYDVEIYRNFGSLLVAVVAISLACTSFGMLLASVAKTQAQAQGLGTLLILTMSSLGGAWWPVEFMKLEILQILARFTIVFWGVEGFLAALWENATIVQMLPILGVILLFCVVLNAISLWRFRKGDLFR